MSNYNHIRRLTDKLLHEYYQSIEKDLEKIINAPSLLARLSKYYQLYQEPIAPNHECYLIFVYNRKIYFIKEWTIDNFLEHKQILQKVELWYESTLSIIHSDPIMFPGRFE